jgi:hypothetical protein
MIAGAGDPLPDDSLFLHGESPSSGQSWMSQGAITFDKLKLTNNRYLQGTLTEGEGSVQLTSSFKLARFVKMVNIIFSIKST